MRCEFLVAGAVFLLLSVVVFVAFLLEYKGVLLLSLIDSLPLLFGSFELAFESRFLASLKACELSPLGVLAVLSDSAAMDLFEDLSLLLLCVMLP